MRKLSAPRSVFSACFAILITGAILAMQACTAGEGATPTCAPDVNAEGNQHLPDGCNKFAVCRANPLDANSSILPAEECCKDSNGQPLQGYLLKLCLYGYGEDIDLSPADGGG